jgi:DNA-binding response OmpR family regulator
VSAPRLLLLDDDQVSGLTFSLLLEDAGYEVVRADTIAAARAKLRDGPYAGAILDVHLPDGLGPSLIPLVREAHRAAVVIILSGSAGEGVPGADHVLMKGADPQEALRAIDAAIRAS